MQGKSNAQTSFNTVRNPENQQVTMERTVSQTFSDEDFVAVFKDTKRQLKQIDGQISQIEDQMDEILTEKNLEMGVLHDIIEGKSFEGEIDIEDYQDAVDADAIEQYQQLQQQDQQLDQMYDQKEQIERQMGTMREAAETIVDSREDLTLELEENQPEKKEIKTEE